MRRQTKQPRRLNREPGTSSPSALSGRVLRGGAVGYYPCTVEIAGVQYPCDVLEWSEWHGARVRYAGPDGQDRLTTVDAEQVTVG